MRELNQKEIERAQETDYSVEIKGVVVLAVGLGVAAVVMWPGFFTAAAGGALSGGGAWLLKKAFGK